MQSGPRRRVNLKFVRMKTKNFVRIVTGLECHQLERYILDMNDKWDDVIEYHFFKCPDLVEENLVKGDN